MGCQHGKRFGLALVLCVTAPLWGAESDGKQTALIIGPVLHEWTFDAGVGGWQALHDCDIAVGEGVMKITSTGQDPYLAAAVKAAGPGVVVTLRVRSTSAGAGQVFWATDQAAGFAEARSKHFEMIHDGTWHEYAVPVRVAGTITSLRLDPGAAAGTVEVDWIRLRRGGPHPLTIERIETKADRVVAHVRNAGGEAVTFRHDEQAYSLGAGETMTLTQKLSGRDEFERGVVKLTPQGLPAVVRSVVAFYPERKRPGIRSYDTFGDGELKVLISREPTQGFCARIERKGKIVAVMAPIVRIEGWPHLLARLSRSQTDPPTTATYGCPPDGIRVDISVKGDEVMVAVDSKRDAEGPCVRAIGVPQQGLFAGLEYLGAGERSSSKLDIETDAHDRTAPDPMLVTMPLMACVTDRATVAMTWKDMTLRPVFASPNALDGTDDHRMGLRGRKFTATIRVSKASLAETIEWAVKKAGGLPAPPKPPRDDAAQDALTLRCLDGPVRSEAGWGHCAEPKWTRHWYADVASTIWRITGKAPQTGPLVPGGAHVRNDAIYFVTGQAERWLALRRREAKGLLATQKPDGSFRYAGKFRKGHFEDTASGHCARPAATLLEWARFSGDADARAAGLKALAFMQRFRTPRGAQTWELSLHTPDILAAAYLVKAYTLGYEITGQAEHLTAARNWAFSGVPFVYLWSNRPTMLYATVPVYGATNYRAPLWIGRPVQWCGGVYAHALVHLARHDRTFDWRRLARGIYIAAQQMQYPVGRLAGCLPDVFELPTQHRAGPSINPCAIASLQRALAGQVDSLAVATDGTHRIVAPLPVTIRAGRARIQGRKGLTYQVVIDGRRVVTIESRGIDELNLATPAR